MEEGISKMKSVVARQVTAQDIEQYIDDAANPLSALFLAYQALGAQPELRIFILRF